MFETPYQTTPCSRFVMDKTTQGVRRLEIEERLIHANGQSGIKLVPSGVIDFLPFQQPLTKVEIPTLETSVVIDGRSMLRGDGTVNKSDVYNHALLTARLTELWYTGDFSIKRDMLNLGDLPAKAFMSWVAGAIGLRLGLDFGQTSLLRGLLAVYWIQLHGPIDPHHHTMAEKDRLVSRVSRLMPGSDIATVESILGEVPVLNNLADFIRWAIEKLQSPRVDQLTVAALYSYLGFSFGPAHREAVAVALEYPPVFYALCYSALQERSYSKTGLGKVIERTISRGNDKEFVKSVNQLIKGQ